MWYLGLVNSSIMTVFSSVMDMLNAKQDKISSLAHEISSSEPDQNINWVDLVFCETSEHIAILNLNIKN